MSNPFEYGGIVKEAAFCNRLKEMSDINNAIENADNLFIYAERRLGKTSLIKTVLNKLSKEKYIPVYVDLWSTNNEAELALALARSVSQASAGTQEKLIEFARQFFSFFKPSVTVNDEGKPQLLFGVSSHDSLINNAIEDVLNSLPQIAAKSKKQVVIALDEFQQILEYDQDGDIAERRIRSAVQLQSDIAYVFLGSRKHIIQQMFLDKQRPLYRSAQHYPLGMIATKHWAPFITQKFEETNKYIDTELIDQLCNFTGGHPFYTQHVCHALWELTDTESGATKATLEEAVELLLDRETYAFSALWDSLAKNQRILTLAIASANAPFKPFAGDFVKRSGMRTASNVQRAAEALLEKDIIERDADSSFFVSDRFFKLWIERLGQH